MNDLWTGLRLFQGEYPWLFWLIVVTLLFGVTYTIYTQVRAREERQGDSSNHSDRSS